MAIISSKPNQNPNPEGDRLNAQTAQNSIPVTEQAASKKSTSRTPKKAPKKEVAPKISQTILDKKT